MQAARSLMQAGARPTFAPKYASKIRSVFKLNFAVESLIYGGGGCHEESMSDSARFHKILSLAVNPAAPNGEAQAAFDRLRELVRRNPHLTAPPPQPPMPPPVRVKPDDETHQWRLTKIPPFWLLITFDNLSGQAYDLGLRSRFSCDFKDNPTALLVTCTGQKDACGQFGKALSSLLSYINSQPAPC
jgi:hypothetical protein